MATEGQQFFDCLCRTCMHELPESPPYDTSAPPDQQWQCIFNTIEECDMLPIAQLLANAIPQLMEAHQSDELPKKICGSCLQQLLIVYRFQQMCTQSDQQMRALIANRTTDSLVSMIEASVKYETNANKIVKQLLLESNQTRTLEFESVTPLAEAPQTHATDPLQNIEVVMEHSSDTEYNAVKCVKNEPFDDESNGEYSDGETQPLKINAKTKMLRKTTKREQVGLSGYRSKSLHHAKTQKKLPRYVCDICEGTFSTSSSLHRHKRRYHSNVKPKKKLKTLPCDLCDEKFNTHAKLEKHKQLRHSSEALNTAIAAENKVSTVERKEEPEGLAGGQIPQGVPKAEIDTNLPVETVEKPGGGQNPQSVPKEMENDANVITKVEQDELIDGEPTQSFNNTNSSKHICAICENRFSTKSSLMRHIKRYHSNEKPKRALKKPNTAHLPNETRPKVVKYRKKREKKIKQYSCNLCDKTYKNSEALKIHIRKHTGERPYLCPECGKSFSDPSNLKQHILRHGDDKLFECPYCPLKFRCPNYVAQHKMIHEGIRRHVCDICGASFTKTCQLAVHKRYHNNDKPFKCEYCEMRFVRKSAQRVHMRTHTGEKPYQCKYCDRAFAQSGDHIKHLRTHLGDNVYRCELCPLTFRLASELRAHFVTHKHNALVTPELNMPTLREEETKLLLKFDELAKVSQEQVERKIAE